MPIIAKRKLFTNVAAYAPAAAGAWTPASVSTDVWFDADNAASITKDGSNKVSQWNDLSGNGRHAFQATAVDKFVDTASVQNGKHGLLCLYDDGAGASSFMQIPVFTRAQPFIMCFAFKTTTMVSWSTIWDGNAATGSGARPFVLVEIADGGGSHQGMFSLPSEMCIGGSLLANSTPYYLICGYDGASSKLRRNGASIAGASSIGTTGISVSSMLASWVAGSGFAGYFLEFFIIPGNSATNITNAETYLAAKWAI